MLSPQHTTEMFGVHIELRCCHCRTALGRAGPAAAATNGGGSNFATGPHRSDSDDEGAPLFDRNGGGGGGGNGSGSGLDSIFARMESVSMLC